MNVKSISYSGIKKTAATTIGLAPLTIVTGANRGGKTTVRDALLLALNGAHPSLPKTNQGVMGLASGPELLAAVTFDNDATLERSWRVSKGGSIKSETIGTPPAIAIEQFEPMVFLAMGGKARLGYLAAMASADLIRAIIERRLGSTDWAMDIYDAASDAVGAMEAIEKAIIERRKAAKQERDRLTKAMQEHVATAPIVTDADSALAAAADEIIVAERQLYLAMIQARNEHGAIAERRSAYEAALKKQAVGSAPALTVEEIAEAAELQRQHDRAVDQAERRGAIAARIAAAEANLLVEPLIDTLRQAVDIAGATTAYDADEAAEVQEHLQAAESDLRFVEALIKAEAENIEAVKSRVIEPICAHCGHAIDLVAAEAQRQEQLDAMQARTTAASDRQTQARQAIAYSAELLKILERRRQIHSDAAIAADRLAADERQRETINALRAELSEIPVFSETAAARLRDLEARNLANQQAAGNVPAVVKAAEVEHATSALTALRDQHKAAQDRVAVLEVAQQKTLALTNWEQRAQAMSENLDRAKGALLAIEAIEDDFEAGKTEMLNSVWQPITEIANRIVAETFGDDTLSVVHDGTDIGLRDLAGYRTFGTISGSEATVLAFAIGAAIASQGDLRLAIIDELGALDSNTRPQFLASIGKLVKDKMLDQVIVFHHDDGGAVAAGFEKHVFA